MHNLRLQLLFAKRIRKAFTLQFCELSQAFNAPDLISLLFSHEQARDVKKQLISALVFSNAWGFTTIRI